MMKTIDLIVLAFDGPYVRAYLEAMRAKGVSPLKIIELRLRGPTTLSRCSDILLGHKCAHLMAKMVDSFKPQLKSAEYLNNGFGHFFPFRPGFFGKIEFTRYSSNVETVYAKDINDPTLLKFLTKQPCRNFLFTGGGILKKNLLGIPDSRFIHIHPAILPEIRGADCLFWSLLQRGKPGATIFYMNEEIDTGEIIAQDEYDVPLPVFEQGAFSNQDMYRALIKVLDPLVRAKLLARVIEDYSNRFSFGELPSRIQDSRNGRTYFFLNRKLRDRTIERFFVTTG